MRGFPSQNALTFFRAKPEPSSCRINSSDMRSVGHITHRVFLGILGGITGVVDIAAAASIIVSTRLVHNTKECQELRAVRDGHVGRRPERNDGGYG